MYARVISTLISLWLVARPWFAGLVYHADSFLLGSFLFANIEKAVVDPPSPSLAHPDHVLPVFSDHQALDPIFGPHVLRLPCGPADSNSPHGAMEITWFNQTLPLKPHKSLYMLFVERLRFSTTARLSVFGSFDLRLDPKVAVALALVVALFAVWTLLFSLAGVLHAISTSSWWRRYLSFTHPTLGSAHSSETGLTQLTRNLLSAPSTSGLGSDVTHRGPDDTTARLTGVPLSHFDRQQRYQYDESPFGTPAPSDTLETSGASDLRQPRPLSPIAYAEGLRAAIIRRSLSAKLNGGTVTYRPAIANGYVRRLNSKLDGDNVSHIRPSSISPDASNSRGSTTAHMHLFSLDVGHDSAMSGRVSDLSVFTRRNAFANGTRGQERTPQLPNSPSSLTVNPNDDFWMDAVNDPEFAPRRTPRSDGTISNQGSAEKSGPSDRYRSEKRVGFAPANQHIRSQSLDSSIDSITMDSPSPAPRNPSLLPVACGPRRYAKYVPPHRRAEGEVKWTTASPGPHGIYLGNDSSRSTWTPFDLDPPRSKFIELSDFFQLSAVRIGSPLEREDEEGGAEREEWKACNASPPDWRNHRRSTSLFM